MERVSFLVGRSIELDVVCAPLDQPQPHNLLLHGVAQLVPLYPVTQRHPGLQAGLILTAVSHHAMIKPTYIILPLSCNSCLDLLLKHKIAEKPTDSW